MLGREHKNKDQIHQTRFLLHVECPWTSRGVVTQAPDSQYERRNEIY